jgi:hypothetical protein
MNHSEEGGSNSEKEVSNENKDIFIASFPGYCTPPAIVSSYAGNSKTNTFERHSPRKYWLKPPILKTRGFTTAFS